jgi:hypothetical protein
MLVFLNGSVHILLMMFHHKISPLFCYKENFGPTAFFSDKSALLKKIKIFVLAILVRKTPF